MTRLILDHGRRWGWLLALAGLYAFWQGWAMARRPEEPFEFWILLLAMWSGSMLLSLDSKRGIARVLALVPLSARQVGRALWLAAVALPAVVMSLLLFLGALAYGYAHPNAEMPLNRLGWASLFTVLWLGLLFNTNRVGVFTLLSTIMMFAGMIYFQDASHQPFKLALFLTAGGFLSIVGWRQPEGFLRMRTLPPTGAASVLKYRHGQSRPPVGSGGLWFLIRTNVVRLFCYLASMLTLMALLMVWQGWSGLMTLTTVMLAGLGSFMAGWFTLYYGLPPVLQHLRALRTLPISSNCLAAVLLAIVLLPFVVLGPLAAGVAELVSGSADAVLFLRSYALILAPLALCVALAVRCGVGTLTYTLQFVVLFAFYILPLWGQTLLGYKELSWTGSVSLTGSSVLIGFLLTSHALRQKNYAH